MLLNGVRFFYSTLYPSCLTALYQASVNFPDRVELFEITRRLARDLFVEKET